MDKKLFVSNYERPYFYTQPPPPPSPPPATVNHQSHGFNLNDEVSPSVLLIIIILAIIFFISGLLHLLVRFFMRPINRDPDEFDNVTALQGQLQQLFNLHDSGVDQSFIDTLPVFTYKSIIGVKDPFDCAVCLCEFEGDDKLRLLPKCSHAFHMDCIDTWLLSHSTCPLCRASLISDFTPNSCFSPIVFVLESGSSEISREIVNSDQPNGSSIQRVNSHLSNQEFEFNKGEMVKDDIENKEKVVTIKLGKFKNVDGGECSSDKQTIDARRCFSMGSFEYVMNENSSLQVPISTQVKKQAINKSSLPITPSHRPTMSECGIDSRRDFKGIELFGGGGGDVGVIGKSKRESFSVSKISLRGKKEKGNSTVVGAIGPSSRGSFSFRFPVHRNELKVNRRANSELEIRRWENDEENQICQWFDSPPQEESNPPSFARRTLYWLMGREQIKIVHSSSSTNV